MLRCVYITSLLLSSSCFIAYLDGTHREYNGNNEKQNSSNKPSGNSPSFKIIWQMILQRLADTVPIQRVRKHTKEHVLGSSNIFHWNKKIVSLNGDRDYTQKYKNYRTKMMTNLLIYDASSGSIWLSVSNCHSSPCIRKIEKL